MVWPDRQKHIGSYKARGESKENCWLLRWSWVTLTAASYGQSYTHFRHIPELSAGRWICSGVASGKGAWMLGTFNGVEPFWWRFLQWLSWRTRAGVRGYCLFEGSHLVELSGMLRNEPDPVLQSFCCQSSTVAFRYKWSPLSPLQIFLCACTRCTLDKSGGPLPNVRGRTDLGI